ncbi:MAG: gliding motility-associated C-terminal domain-containing protein [Flavobacteriia bacterium]|nr:gliding motility-associated C-terminal domain-containing protein [Flavobacteriia bacterium]
MRFILILILFFLALPVYSQQEGILLHPNKGQWDLPILYKIELNLGEMFLTKDGFTYALNDYNIKHGNHEKNQELNENDKIGFQILKSSFIGSSWMGEVAESNPSQAYRNYFQGNNPDKWKSKIYSYKTVELKNYYPQINFLVEGQSSNLKYSFVAAPHADITQIQYKIEGSDKIYLDGNGNLHITNRFGEIIENKPIAWNEIDGKKQFVKVKFKLKNNVISFEFPNGYDQKNKLIIDPTLTFSTFTGSTMDNWGMTATPDMNGNLYAGGIVFVGPGSYPATTGAFDVTFNGGTSFSYTLNGSTYNTPGFDVAISKFNSAGTALLYSTYLGGAGNEAPHSLVSDNNGDLYVLGVTSSANFPVLTNAFDNSFNGGPNITENELGYNDGADLFIAHLNANGTTMVGATFIGGTGTDGVNIGTLNFNYGDPFRGEIIVDNAGYIYVSSTSRSSDFPTLNPVQGTLQGLQDAVLFKINTSLTTLSWSTYFGNSGLETGNSVQISSNGFVYMAGGTNSNSLAIGVGEDLSFNGGISDGYLSKFNANTGNIISGTFMGLNEYDQAYFVQLDLNNEVYVYGQTESDWGITAGHYGVPNSGQFIRKYNNNLTSILWTTMIGAGTGHVEISPTAFLVSDCFDIYITGWGGIINSNYSNQAQNSTTFGFQVTADAYQGTTNGSNFYIALLGQNANTLKYASFMGGANSSYNHVDGGTSRFDKNGKIYHAVCAACGGQDNGFTTTPGVYSPTNNSTNCNLAAFKFELSSIEAIISEPQTYICIPEPVVFNNNSANGNSFFWNFGDGATSTAVNPSHLYGSAGIYNVTLVVSDSNGCFSADSIAFQVEIGDFQGGAVQPVTPICKGSTYQLEAYGGANYLWSPSNVLDNPASPTPFATIDVTTDFTVIVSDSCGSDTITITLQVFTTEPLISNDTSICIGNSVPLFVGNTVSQSWTPTNTLNNPNSATPIATPTIPTMYYVTMFTTDNCEFHDSVFVNVFYDSPVPIIEDTVKLCNGDTTLLIVSGAESYNWLPNYHINILTGDSVLVSPDFNMYYYCDFTNACGTIRDSVFMKIQIPVITAGNDTIICPGDKALVWANGGINYQWFPMNSVDNQFGQTTFVHPNINTNYFVLGTDIYGCTDTAFVEVDLYPQIYIQACPDIYAFQGDVVTLYANTNIGGTYTWSPSEHLSCVNCMTPSANPNQNYTYTVTLTDSHGCIATDDVKIFYDGILYVPNTFTPDGNMFNNVFKAIGGNIISFKMEIFNRWGELIFSSNSMDESWDGTYNGLPCPIGTYTWKIEYSDYNNSRKMLVGHVNIVK